MKAAMVAVPTLITAEVLIPARMVRDATAPRSVSDSAALQA